MGTSFTDFSGHGFWTRDGLISATLGLLVLELEESTPEYDWLEPALDAWTLHAIGCFQGGVSADFNGFLTTPDRLAIVHGALARLPARIAGCELVVVAGDQFDARARRVWHDDVWDRPQADGQWLLRVVTATSDLLAGNLVSPLESSLFIGKDSDFYLNAPPELMVHRWMLEADRAHTAGDRVELIDDFRGALAEAADKRRWQTEVETLALPGLSKAVVTSKKNDVRLTILASGIGRLVTGFVDRPYGGRFDVIAKEAGCRGVLSTLSAQGWRYAPQRWLERPYDGVVTDLTSRAAPWWDRLLGEAPRPQLPPRTSSCM